MARLSAISGILQVPVNNFQQIIDLFPARLMPA